MTIDPHANSTFAALALLTAVALIAPGASPGARLPALRRHSRLTV